MSNNNQSSTGLQKSLKLIFIYTVATGSIFTFVSYWDSVFFSYCGTGTFLAFALMTLAILPVTLVYSELAPLFNTAGGELIYNTVAFNKHLGFLASWLIMAAWISVPPAVVMAITTWLSRALHLHLDFTWIVIISILLLIFVFLMSLQDIQVLVKAQATMLFVNIASTLISGLLLIFSGHWHIANIANIFNTNLDTINGIPGWVIGMALLITPYFGFETVPQMVEEGDFPIKNTKKAIAGSVITCGTIYTFFFFCVAGMDGVNAILNGEAKNGFLTITVMEKTLGWMIWPLVYGFFSVFMGMGASILGFWMSTVRMLYSMSKKNFLPEIFQKLNKHQQPILPNVFLFSISLVFILLQNSGSPFMESFFNLMSFGCACAYALTMISAVRIHHKYPKWKSPNAVKGGDFVRILAMIIMIAVAFFCTLGQGIDSWIAFGVYLAVGAVVWLWMVLVKWKKSKVSIQTPDGEKIY